MTVDRDQLRAAAEACMSLPPRFTIQTENEVIARFVSRASPEKILALLDDLDAADARRDELLALVRKISSETPLPEEANDLRGQVAALVAEVGTLRAVRVEALGLVRVLRDVEQPTEGWKNDMLDSIIEVLKR